MLASPSEDERDVAPVPIDAGLFAGDADAPQLVGSRCRECGEVTFPRQDGCPCCTASAMEDVLLARRGKLWTFTIQRFPPPVPYSYWAISSSAQTSRAAEASQPDRRG